jgi:hypothetical protein
VRRGAKARRKLNLTRHASKTYWGSAGVAPHVLNLASGQLHDPAALSPVAICKGGSAGSRAGTHTVKRKTFVRSGYRTPTAWSSNL